MTVDPFWIQIFVAVLTVTLFPFIRYLFKKHEEIHARIDDSIRDLDTRVVVVETVLEIQPRLVRRRVRERDSPTEAHVPTIES